MRDQKLFIDGAWVDGVDTFEVHDPFDGSWSARSRSPAPTRPPRR